METVLLIFILAVLAAWAYVNFGSLLITFMAFVICVAAYGSFKDFQAWPAFKVEHNCKIVSTTVPSFLTPSKVAWLCDDGITYYQPNSSYRNN